MSQKIKHATAGQIVHFGPFMTTAGAPATGLTIANTDVKLLKRGGTAFVNKNSGGLTEIGQGVYYGTFNATDSDTTGDMEAHINVAGAMPLRADFDVLQPNVYESLVTGTEFLEISPIGPDLIASGGNMQSYKRDDTTLQRSKPFTSTASGSADVITQFGS